MNGKKKCIYYNHLSSKDSAIKAKALGFDFNEEHLEMLKNAQYAVHVDHLVTIGDHGGWSREIVEARAEQILEIVSERVSNWIE